MDIMKKIFCVWIISAATVTASHAQPLHAFMRNCAFLSQKSNTPYVETYLSVPGFDLTYVKNEAGKFEGALEVLLLYLKDTTVFTYDKYLLRTPGLSDTANIGFTILDLRRVALPDGEYTVKLKVKDVNRPERIQEITQGLNVSFDRAKVSVSDIELIQTYSPTTEKNLYSKNGYDIKPLASSLLPTAVERLPFYAEIYNAASVAGGSDLVITYAIKHAAKNQVAGDLFRFTKQKAASINILFSEFDIQDLPTGNYLLELQVKNKNNEVLAEQSTFFQRLNKKSSTELNNIALIDVSDRFVRFIPGDSMRYFCKSIMPRAELYEREYISRAIQSNDTLLMKQFFYNFWQKRNPENPVEEWANYYAQVKAVNYHYSTPIYYGFETDRGRVYLQYGPPNRIDGSTNESSTYPYEIWQYYSLGNQSNVKFVFCNFDLVSNEYELIHSTARGELYDARWQYQVYKSFRETDDYHNLDKEDFRSVYGSQVDDYYNNR
jgi:GWxTD domain-containing protein